MIFHGNIKLQVQLNIQVKVLRSGLGSV